jgi:hypothetical protein
MFFQSFNKLVIQKTLMKELFSVRNQAKCIYYLPPLLLPLGGLACFVAFWGRGLAVYMVCVLVKVSASMISQS